MLNLREWYEAFLDLLFPGVHQCFFCSKAIDSQHFRGVCEACSAAILDLSQGGNSCSRCGSFTGGGSCPNCADWGRELAKVVSVVPYEGIFREMVNSLKYGGAEEVATCLGFLMAARVKQTDIPAQAGLIVPVPLYPLREAKRGFNQSALLAREVSRLLAIPCEEKVLFRKHGEKVQSRLKRNERKHNLDQAFESECATRLTGQSVLLVDDIVTSGATLQACARVLLQGGAQSVFGLTWAAGRQKYYGRRQEERTYIEKIGKKDRLFT